MNNPTVRRHLHRTLEDLAEEAEALQRATVVLDSALGALGSGAFPQNWRPAVTRIQGAVVTVVLNLLSVSARTERAGTLAEMELLAPSEGGAEGESVPGSEEDTMSLDRYREGAANALAAALLKSAGADLGASEDWQSTFKAAGTVVDAIAEYVIARIRGVP